MEPSRARHGRCEPIPTNCTGDGFSEAEESSNCVWVLQSTQIKSESVVRPRMSCPDSRSRRMMRELIKYVRQCDGLRPRCSACANQDLECVYASIVGDNTQVPKIFLDLVESRLASVESDLHELKSQFAAMNTNGVPRQELNYTPSAQANNGGSESLSSEAHDGDLDQERSPDGTDGVGTIEFTDGESWEYFGPSSNIAFTRIIRRALALVLNLKESQESLPPATSQPRMYKNTLTVSRPQSPPKKGATSRASSRVDASLLPKEEYMSSLVRQFFSDTGMLFPYINEQRFWATYSKLQKLGPTSVRKSWLGLLNMIMAMATSTRARSDVDMEQRYSQSEVYFNRARTLCLDGMNPEASLEAVQVMILITQYLQGTQRSIKTWAIHGLAVKMAFQLGLQSEQVLDRFDPLERETRIRTWYGCAALDRSLSVTFGRPPSIPEAFIRVRMPCHYIESQAQNTAPLVWGAEERTTIFWNATMGLYKISAVIIQDLYGSNIGVKDASEVEDIASTIIQVERQLTNWQMSLPDSMKLVAIQDLQAAEGNVLHWKFRVILSLRYHSIHILCHRPILKHYMELIDDQKNSSGATLQHIGQLSKTACLNSARAIIGLVSTCTASSGDDGGSAYLGAWWFTLYYTFNAALTIAAIILTQHVSASQYSQGQNLEETASLDRDLERAIQAMVRIDSRNAILNKCVKFTTTLRHLLQGLQSNSLEDSIGVSGVAVGQESMTNMDSDLSYHNGSLSSMMNDFFSSTFDFHDTATHSGDLLMSPNFLYNFSQRDEPWQL
ncbi:unnamed protein product [Clonostachys byssicola]|uniref:Xylanolytic transcriptional activator regulatory domain-containing protein n=1 Tax=Clonostachys byssicola TaxID=160290 RepID=A0A9N9Y0F6_9HYPO|nr:unnamed protein product [Clonostachys byssicola]